MSKRFARIGLKLLLEAAVVGIGVLLALAADEWREGRSELRRVDAGLAIMSLDLRADSKEFEEQMTESTSHVEAAARLIHAWADEGARRDSIEMDLFRLMIGSTPEFSRAGYDGLREAARLSLIEDDSLRMEMARYYQTTLPSLLRFYDLLLDLQVRFQFERIPPYVQHVTGELASEGRGIPQLIVPELYNPMLWPDPSVVRLRGTWGQLTRDPQIHSDIVWLGRMRAVYHGYLSAAQQAAHALAQSIDQQLNS